MCTRRAKLAMDAGQLPPGLRIPESLATGDVEVLLAQRPDCVTFMAAKLDVEIVEAFLRGGANVVTTSNGHRQGPTSATGGENACDTAGKASRAGRPSWARVSIPGREPAPQECSLEPVAESTP